MLAFFVKYTLILALFYAFYLLFLEKEKMHQFNRFFLLAILGLALIVPNISFHTEKVFTAPGTMINEASSSWLNTEQYLPLLLSVYIPITTILLIRFGIHISKLQRKVKSNPKVKLGKATIVLLEENILPHSFFSYIFVNKEEYSKDNIQEELFTHELTHVKQWHSADILLVELYHILFWFNPLLIKIKKSVRLNHEYIADSHVIDLHPGISNYQMVLLDLVSLKKTNPLSSNINYGITKKRFKMMSKRGSHRVRTLFKFALVPLVFGSFILFANIQHAHDNALPGHTHSSETEHHDEGRESGEGEHHNNEHRG